MSRKSLILLTLAVVLGTVGLMAWRLDRRPRVAATFGEATRGPISREVLTSGTLQPTREVETGARVSGTVQAVHADFNDRVAAGEIIAQLDPSVFDSEVAQARAEVIKADADVEAKQVVLDDATVKAKRARELRQQDLINQAELDGAELATRQAAADLTSAKAASRATRAALAQAQLNRGHTVIRAPIAGIVVNRNVEVGQTLAARVQAPVLFRIADLRKMQMLIAVSEAEVGGVRPGTDVTFQIESLGPQQFHGTVAEVRLQPVYESGATGPSGTTTPTGTTGATSGATATATSPAGTAATPTAGSQSGAGASTASNAAAPSGTSPAQPSTAQGAPTSTTPPAGSVVLYTAIVDVENPDGRIAPGTTAIVTLPTAQRRDVLRVPNNALAFRPSPEMLEATVQATAFAPRASASAPHAPADQPVDKSLKAGEPQDADPTRGRAGSVWKFENGKFVPVEVRAGASDETWTEILSGSVQPGDRLVTSATVARHVP